MQTDLFGDPILPPVKPGEAKPARARESVSLAVPCLPASHPPLLQAAGAALGKAPSVYLGTSSWSFPGWRGLLYRDAYSPTALAHDGLRAYAANPFLDAVGIDRSFYAPLSIDEYARYASQVPEHFRFVVKAPARVCDAALRTSGGMRSRANPDFLDARIALDTFVLPCLTGLGTKAGVMVFQLSPLDDASLADVPAFVDRLARFFETLQTAVAHATPTALFALEIRDAAMLTPRLIRMLREQGVRYCVGIHSRMPDAHRQGAALAMLDSERPGPLVVRWSLHAGMRYDGAKARYEPFDTIIDADLPTRSIVAEWVARAVRAEQASFVIVNNKAEGSSPLSCAWLALAIAEALSNDKPGVPTPGT